MLMLVLSGGLEDYQKVSQHWRQDDVLDIKKQVDKLLSMKERSYPACGTQEVFIIPESEKEKMAKLKVIFQKWLYESGTEHYQVSRQVSIW